MPMMTNSVVTTANPAAASVRMGSFNWMPPFRHEGIGPWPRARFRSFTSGWDARPARGQTKLDRRFRLVAPGLWEALGAVCGPQKFQCLGQQRDHDHGNDWDYDRRENQSAERQGPGADYSVEQHQQPRDRGPSSGPGDQQSP